MAWGRGCPHPCNNIPAAVWEQRGSCFPPPTLSARDTDINDSIGRLINHRLALPTSIRRKRKREEFCDGQMKALRSENFKSARGDEKLGHSATLRGAVRNPQRYLMIRKKLASANPASISQFKNSTAGKGRGSNAFNSK